MRYAFFEPRNESFFLKVVRALCWGYYSACIQLYHESKDEKGEVDLEEGGKLRDNLEMPEWKKRLSIFNCSLCGFDILDESCLDYGTAHTKLLTGEQYEKMREFLLDVKERHIVDVFSDPLMGVQIQNILEDEDVVILGAAHALSITEKGDTVVCLGKYVGAAIKFVEETRKTGPVGGYAYIRGKDSSDFDEFKRLTQSVPELENLVACDNFQRFE